MSKLQIATLLSLLAVTIAQQQPTATPDDKPPWWSDSNMQQQQNAPTLSPAPQPPQQLLNYLDQLHKNGAPPDDKPPPPLSPRICPVPWEMLAIAAVGIIIAWFLGPRTNRRTHCAEYLSCGALSLSLLVAILAIFDPWMTLSDDRRSKMKAEKLIFLVVFGWGYVGCWLFLPNCLKRLLGPDPAGAARWRIYVFQALTVGATAVLVAAAVYLKLEHYPANYFFASAELVLLPAVLSWAGKKKRREEDGEVQMSDEQPMV